MPAYKAPVRDMTFVRDEVFDFHTHWQTLPHCADATPDVMAAVVEAVATFSENVLAPLNRSGDEEGCTWTEDGVRAPSGFKAAYQQYVADGWPGLTGQPEYGGQGFPPSVENIVTEFTGAANWAWDMYSGLTKGARATITAHGTPEQQRVYLPKLVSGEWSATMCLTEAHCGTDLGMLRTRAEPAADGSYRITGTKIFISSGDHDVSGNIVHIVLARLPDSPPGTKGISLFIVPKFMPAADGSAGEANGVSCGSIEHKMGLHGNATCVLNFDNARGFLLGEVNRGLNCMFTFMNVARIGTAMQGVVNAELALQGAVAYARERLQMRSLSGPKNPGGPADPIIVHPDVRRMLLTIKAFAEGNRLLIHYLSHEVDITHLSADAADREQAERFLALMTPIAKGFCTETGVESASLGVQVFGGHGYVREWGMEQNLRDARISTIYEGTSGIQALDLLGRKVLGTQGKALGLITGRIRDYCEAHSANRALAEFIRSLRDLADEWEQLTRDIGFKALQDPEEVGAASFDYLMYAGYVSLALMWAMAAETADRQLKAGSTESAFYNGKLATARFYYAKLLPRTRSLVATIKAGAEPLTEIAEDSFIA